MGIVKGYTTCCGAYKIPSFRNRGKVLTTQVKLSMVLERFRVSWVVRLDAKGPTPILRTHVFFIPFPMNAVFVIYTVKLQTTIISTVIFPPLPIIFQMDLLPLHPDNPLPISILDSVTFLEWGDV